MDRMAVLLNLRDTRDLELAKAYITRERNRIWNEFQIPIDNLSTVNYMQIEPVGESLTGQLGLLVLAGFFLALIALSCFPGLILKLLGLLIGGGMAWFFGSLFFDSLTMDKIDNEKREQNEKAEQHNAVESARLKANMPQIEDLKQEQKARDNFWCRELEKVDLLLEETYKANLIPAPFRHRLAAVQYIYEYMSSAPVSLEHTLMSAQLEDGIRRIEAKLDIMINQQQEIAFQLRRQEANNRQMAIQNREMLESLKNMERNTLEAAQYAQISASYNKTTAFFSTANYFDRLLS